jgi:hypothetical protein
MRGYGEINWFTKDQGDTYTRVEFGALVDLKLHPKKADWVLASKYEGSFPNRYLSLFVTQDFGKSWKKLVSNVFQFEWADPEMKDYQEKTIFACVRKEDSTPKSAVTSWDPNIDFVVSNDLFARYCLTKHDHQTHLRYRRGSDVGVSHFAFDNNIHTHAHTHTHTHTHTRP